MASQTEAAEGTPLEQMLFEVKKTIVGQEALLERIVVALLEVMQERQVTIGRESHKVPAPFLVLATQNPIETEGTYALPEAQVDRFMLKVLVGYPTDREEVVIVQRMTGTLAPPRQILTTDELLALQKEADAVYVDPELMEYAVRLVSATRRPDDFRP